MPRKKQSQPNRSQVSINKRYAQYGTYLEKKHIWYKSIKGTAYDYYCDEHKKDCYCNECTHFAEYENGYSNGYCYEKDFGFDTISQYKSNAEKCSRFTHY